MIHNFEILCISVVIWGSSELKYRLSSDTFELRQKKTTSELRRLNNNTALHSQSCGLTKHFMLCKFFDRSKLECLENYSENHDWICLRPENPSLEANKPGYQLCTKISTLLIISYIFINLQIFIIHTINPRQQQKNIYKMPQEGTGNEEQEKRKKNFFVFNYLLLFNAKIF